MDIKIRTETEADRQAIWNVNASAFRGPMESDLVNALRAGGYLEVSLVAEIDGKIVGHILFSRVTVRTASNSFEALSLAPMAVAPEFQERGIGSRLVNAGLKLCRKTDHKI